MSVSTASSGSSSPTRRVVLTETLYDHSDSTGENVGSSDDSDLGSHDSNDKRANVSASNYNRRVDTWVHPTKVVTQCETAFVEDASPNSQETLKQEEELQANSHYFEGFEDVCAATLQAHQYSPIHHEPHDPFKTFSSITPLALNLNLDPLVVTNVAELILTREGETPRPAYPELSCDRWGRPLAKRFGYYWKWRDCKVDMGCDFRVLQLWRDSRLCEMSFPPGDGGDYESHGKTDDIFLSDTETSSSELAVVKIDENIISTDTEIRNPPASVDDPCSLETQDTTSTLLQAENATTSDYAPHEHPNTLPTQPTIPDLNTPNILPRPTRARTISTNRATDITEVDYAFHRTSDWTPEPTPAPTPTPRIPYIQHENTSTFSLANVWSFFTRARARACATDECDVEAARPVRPEPTSKLGRTVKDTFERVRGFFMGIFGSSG